MVRAFVLNRSHPGSIPGKGTGIFSAMLYFVMAIMWQELVKMTSEAGLLPGHLEMLHFPQYFQIFDTSMGSKGIIMELKG